MSLLEQYDTSETVNYHYGKFPPASLNAQILLTPLATAAAAIARYDQMLQNMHNSEILLAPLRNQEAVISSRIEGTISTLDEVLQYEAEQEEKSLKTEHYRNETIEVFLYAKALTAMQSDIDEGRTLSSHTLKRAHQILLGDGRGAHLSPGNYKTEQNYLADKIRRKILFKPISPMQTQSGMDNLFNFINEDHTQILLKTALAHVEFEALHPFNDGNGRIGRMLITIMLWKFGVISAPHFYVSRFFEKNRDEYINRMREVSKANEWDNWCLFFLEALEKQAIENIKTAERIRDLYENLKLEFPTLLKSQWSTAILDRLFSRPVFKGNILASDPNISTASAHRFMRTLVEHNYLAIKQKAAGRRPALYSFEPLLQIVRE